MLVDALLETTDRFGSSPAVADPTRRLTYRRLTAGAAAMRGIVDAHTDCPRVGIMLPASAAFPVALFGALWAGRTVVPLNFLLSPGELRDIVTDAGIDTIYSVHHFDKLLAELPARGVALEDLPLKRKVLFSMLRPTPPPPPVTPSDTAVLLYTSGTSGSPKGVELTHHNLRRNCDACIEAARMTHDHTLLNMLPPFHVFGLTANVLVPIVLGASVYAMPRFQPAAAVKTITQEKISIVMAIPSMYAAMVRVKSAPDDALSSIYLAISGGEPLSETLARQFEQRYGVKLLQGYGLTETSPVLSLCAPHAWRDGSVGRLIPGTECRIVGDDDRELSAGNDGEIQVRGHCVMKGYYRRPDETATVIDADGWLRTGDVGRLDEDGFLYLTGRKKEMIIVSGENVSPREIEEVLVEHLLVAEAAVIGVADTSRGEVPVAFVILTQDADNEPDIDQSLRIHVRRRLAGHKVPRRIHLVGDLPRGPTGKVLKRKLKEPP
ncbi:MAG TPA: AMP-binding protein [Phycisphaerae bacterium]|nr:AMP-binding protein [Phycisphaerae bacterium]